MILIILNMIPNMIWVWQAEASGWTAAGDGFLAIDLDASGTINSHAELFGSGTTDGFALLGAHDGNSDGVIDASDAVFSDLLVWVDGNGNGLSEANELYTLSDLDITSIDATATQVNQTNAGHNISHVSTYTMDAANDNYRLRLCKAA